MQRDDSSEVVATGGSEDSTSRYTAGHDTQRVVVLNYLPVPSPAGCVHLPCTTSLKCLLVQAGGPNPETPGSTGFSQTNDISLFGRKVTRGKSMAQGADDICKHSMLVHDACIKEHGQGSDKCKPPAEDVLECRGNFLCPAVAQMWMNCRQLMKEGKVKAEDCEASKQSLIICSDCNSNE